MNTPHEVKSEDLTEILDSNPDRLLQESSPLLGKLADFILRYAILIANKEAILQQVKLDQSKVHQEDAKLQRQNLFSCVLCCLQPTAVAYVWMQFDNHSGEWKDKKMNGQLSKEAAKKLEVAKYTSKKGGRKTGGSSVSRDGLTLYDKVERFIERFTYHECYDVFQRICNRKAKEYGLLEELTDENTSDVPKLPQCSIEEEDEEIRVPIFANRKRVANQVGV